MIIKSKIAIVAAVAVMGLASPAFAQYDGSIASQSGLVGGSSSSQNETVAVRQSGLYAFAMVSHGARSDNGGSGYDPSISTQR